MKLSARLDGDLEGVAHNLLTAIIMIFLFLAGATWAGQLLAQP